MSESSDIEMIMMYQDYFVLQKRNSPANPSPRLIVGWDISVHVNEAKELLEKIFKIEF